MPGAVAAAAAVDVLPFSLCSAFAHTREWAADINVYANGETQRYAVPDTSRKRWRLGKRLNAEDMATLRDFWLAHRHAEFFFYDVFETDPKFSYDPDGLDEAGRYAVRFEGNFDYTVDFPLNSVSLELVQVS
jgi:hypothetical protein